MANKRKSVDAKADPNKRTKNEEEAREVPRGPVEDMLTARERARLWHEQQMKLRGMRGEATEDKIKYPLREAPIKSEEAPIKTRTRSRLSEIKVEEPKKREPTKRHSEMPLSGVTRTRSRGSTAPATQVQVVKEVMEKREEVTKAVQLNQDPPVEATVAKPEQNENHYKFRTIEQRMNSQPSVLAEIVPRDPSFSPSSEEVPPELSWISLPYLGFFCILMAFIVATLFRTEQCVQLMIKLKFHLSTSNDILTQKFGDAPFGLDYTTWLSVVGVVFLFSFVL